MAGHAPRIGIAPLPAAKVAIISSSWHLDICNDLIAGAKRALGEAQVGTVEVQFVPGSFEIPLAAQYAFDYVCQGVTQGVIDVSLKYGKPIGYGVLMCNDLDQAIARSGVAGSTEDKGYDSAVAALELLRLKNA
jgi:6,7-dimethyl-8-ribityllumazine synthase